MLRSRYNAQTGALWGAYQADVRGFTLAPSYSFAKRAGALAVTRKLSGGQTVRATYALPDRLAVLELANKPFKARAPPQRSYRAGRGRLERMCCAGDVKQGPSGGQSARDRCTALTAWSWLIWTT